jgi:hypothetical protein
MYSLEFSITTFKNYESITTLDVLGKEVVASAFHPAVNDDSPHGRAFHVLANFKNDEDAIGFHKKISELIEKTVNDFVSASSSSAE